MSVTVTRTGRVRTRLLLRWFRKPLLIMQVEEHKKGWYYGPDPNFGAIDIDRTEWRDATVEDLTQLTSGS